MSEFNFCTLLAADKGEWYGKGSGLILISCIFIASFFAWLGLSAISIDKAQSANPGAKRIAAIMLALALSIPLMFDMTQGRGELVNYVFQGLGLRTEHASIRLSGAGLASIKDAASNHGAKLAICNDDDGYATVSPVTILWHGMGERSLISISPASDYLNAKWTELEIPSKDLNFVRGSSTLCNDLEPLVYFESNKDEISLKHQLVELNSKIIKSINEIKKIQCTLYEANSTPIECEWQLKEIIATGSADPLAKSDGSNENLARNRALKVLGELKNNDELNKLAGKLNDENLIANSLGSREMKYKLCPFSGNKAALQECHSGNRYVKVRILFEARKKS